MSDVVPFDDRYGLPAHIQEMFGTSGLNSDLASGIGVGFPILYYKGKVWSIGEGGVRTILENSDGDARASVDVVIVRANPTLSKTFYDGGFVEGSSEKPDCYSHDGKAPAPDAQAPQSHSCAVCPMNQWGSRITDDGRKGKACADTKRLAVAFPDELDKPMLLRIPAASLKGLAQYADALSKRRAPVAAVVTKIKFDPTVAHPQLLFAPTRWLAQHEAEAVLAVADSDVVRQIVGLDHAALPPDDLPGEPPAAMVPPPAPRPAPRPAPAAVAAPRPAPALAPAPAARPAARRPVVTEDEVDAALAGPASEPEPAPAPAPAPVARPAAPRPVVAAASPVRTVAAKPALKAVPAAAPAARPAPAPAPAPAAAAPVSAAARALAEVDASLDDVLASLDD